MRPCYGKAGGKGAGFARPAPYGAPAMAATQSSGDPDEGRMIYVGGMPQNAEWQELKDHMKQAGNVEFVQVLTNEFGQSRGEGFVRFATVEEAEYAIQELNGTQMAGMSGNRVLQIDLWTGEKPKTNKGRAMPDGQAAMGGCGKGGCGKGGCGGGFG